MAFEEEEKRACIIEDRGERWYYFEGEERRGEEEHARTRIFFEITWRKE